MALKAIKKDYLAVNVEHAFMSTVNQNLVTFRDYFGSNGFIDYGYCKTHARAVLLPLLVLRTFVTLASC